MSSDRDKSSGVTDGRYKKKIYGHNKKEIVQVSVPSLEARWFRETLPLLNGCGMQSDRKNREGNAVQE